MIKLVGKISTQVISDSLDVWFAIAKTNNESRKSRIRDSFSDSFIVFDETTTHGTTLNTELTGAGWIEDTSYGVGDYKADGSDRPEFVSQATKDAIKANQDLINDIENKPRVILALDDLPYHERTKAQYDAFSYEVLRKYFTLMVSKQNHISEILELKFLPDTIENRDIEGAKTDADLLIEIATLIADETRTRPPPLPEDNSENITNIKLALADIPYPDKTTIEIDALSYEELTKYHSNMVLKLNLIKQLIELKELELTRANFDAEGVKTFEVIVAEIRAIEEAKALELQQQ